VKGEYPFHYANWFLMNECPHCNETLPTIVDAFCPSCMERLDEPPAAEAIDMPDAEASVPIGS